MHVVVTNAAQDDFFGNRSRNLISCECVYNVDHGNELSNSLPLPQSKVERLFCEYSGLFSMMFVKVKKMLTDSCKKKVRSESTQAAVSRSTWVSNILLPFPWSI